MKLYKICPPPQAQVKELTEKLHSVTESAKAARSQERALKEELHRLTSDLQASKQGQKRLEAEQKESEREIQELKQQNGRFKSALQVRAAAKRPCSVGAPLFTLLASFPLS